MDIFFQGHDHLFAKEVLNNVVYQEVPMAADLTYVKGYTANASAYTDVILDGTGHIKVDVTTNCVTVSYVKSYIPGTTGAAGHTNGEIGYSYSVGACALNTNEVVNPNTKVFVYPNPSKDVVYIVFGDNSINHTYQLTNILGQTVVVFDTNELNTNTIPDGIYFLQIDGINELTKKIIIKH